MTFEVSPDTIFLAIISLTTAIVIPLARHYTKIICNRLSLSEERLDLLEFIASHQHPDLIEKYKRFKDTRKV